MDDVLLTVLERGVAATAEGITISDARVPDRPLVYVNDGFSRMTGYGAAESIGRNCRFLQGHDTDPAAAVAIRASLDAGTPSIVELLNYRRDGSTFLNRLSIVPVADATGAVAYFVGIQSDITALRQAEIDRERYHALRTTMNTVNDLVLNHLNMLQLFRMQFEEAGGAAEHLVHFDAAFAQTDSTIRAINGMVSYAEQPLTGDLLGLDTQPPPG